MMTSNPNLNVCPILSWRVFEVTLETSSTERGITPNNHRRGTLSFRILERFFFFCLWDLCTVFNPKGEVLFLVYCSLSNHLYCWFV